MAITLPTVHLNGTSREALVEQYRAAATKLREALNALEEASPHARDYYLQDPEAYSRARGEHIARLVKISDVRDEVISILEHVAG